MTKQISLTRGKVALVDDVDFDYLNQFKWCAEQNGRHYWYAARCTGTVKQRIHIRMHRQIMNPPDDMMVDHINGDGLDNRRENLRLCSRSQNTWNSRRRRNNKSGYKGVFISGTRFRAQIRCLNKVYSLGSFSTAEEAARAHDAKALELHGPFARTNFQ